MAAAGDEYDPTPSEDELEAHLQTRNMVVNLGPSHPATHGTVRLKIELDGETIVKMDTEIGFLHLHIHHTVRSQPPKARVALVALLLLPQRERERVCEGLHLVRVGGGAE